MEWKSKLYCLSGAVVVEDEKKGSDCFYTEVIERNKAIYIDSFGSCY